MATACSDVGEVVGIFSTGVVGSVPTRWHKLEHLTHLCSLNKSLIGLQLHRGVLTNAGRSSIFYMKEFPESRTPAKVFADKGEKRSDILAKHFADFRPLISRKTGRKKFHEKSSTFSTRVIDLLMGLFRGAVFHHGRDA